MAAERKIAAFESARTESSVKTRAETVSSPAPAVENDSELGTVFGGQYRLETRLGAGGMGTVYRGMQLSIDRPVAVKVIAPGVQQHTQHVQRFRREAEALAKLCHPNTVHLLDFGVTDQGRWFMVMELLTGIDLEAQIAQHGPLDLDAALRIVRQIARSLSEAHALGIIHRDLKPSNVFLCQADGGDSFVKVMDFGVAGFLRDDEDEQASALTLKGTVLGTAAYMSPEQAQGFAVDARADLYSLGVVLFEMLTGRPPFQANSAVSLLIAHVSEEPPRLAQVCPGLPELDGVQALIDDLLAKETSNRLPSAPELIARIDALLAALGEMPMVPSGELIAPQSTARTRTIHRARWPYALTLGLALAAGVVWQRPAEVDSLAPALSLPDLEVVQAQTRELVARAKHSWEQWRRPGLSRVTIASVPSGAKVRLAGAELGTTPYELSLKGMTEVQVDLPGHEVHTLSVDPAGEPNVVVKLVPLPPYIR